MNIFEMYNTYREQHAAEFKGILEDVAKEVLLMTEQIPEDVIRKNFRTNGERRFLYCEGESMKPGAIKDGCLAVSFSGEFGEFIGQFSYDDTAVKKLDEFMETYYPGINCPKAYVLDLYDRKVVFTFCFNVEYSDDDFEWLGHSGILKKGKTNMTTSMTLLTDDIAEVLQQEFTEKDWEALEPYEKEEKISNVYWFGSVFVKISI